MLWSVNGFWWFTVCKPTIHAISEHRLTTVSAELCRITVLDINTLPAPAKKIKTLIPQTSTLYTLILLVCRPDCQ